MVRPHMKVETATSDAPNHHRHQKLSKESKTTMNPKRLIATLIGVTCLLSMFCIYAISQENRGQQEYRGQSFPNDEVIASQPWDPPSYRPARILGKQTISNDEYRLVYSLMPEGVVEMTVIRLDTGLWYHPRAAGLPAGIFTDPKK